MVPHCTRTDIALPPGTILVLVLIVTLGKSETYKETIKEKGNNKQGQTRTRINSAGALLAIRLLSEVIPHYIRTPSVSIRTVLM